MNRRRRQSKLIKFYDLSCPAGPTVPHMFHVPDYTKRRNRKKQSMTSDSPQQSIESTDNELSNESVITPCSPQPFLGISPVFDQNQDSLIFKANQLLMSANALTPNPIFQSAPANPCQPTNVPEPSPDPDCLGEGFQEKGLSPLDSQNCFTQGFFLESDSDDFFCSTFPDFDISLWGTTF
ncbi:hypothetical protein TRFO_02155 [Tritrichomonas foetus]|uniref:Uncharacterized protein n=1 Tax=Tritrichomonas foetus TaxID=1144522 RepID=A0A1J4JC30_9EUKA|nr:hypothetical protein TRFO_02155 [Tritrichomonas foetus]|eukprot:OHS95211.1 hypothetical protein TRFO_02155 [Tritrichomonas foetus]